jgi:cyclic pyranopterin phosphate synthase
MLERACGCRGWAGNGLASSIWRGALMTQWHANSQGPISNSHLVDNYSRSINYLRLSITDRCNLRCRYCRPEEGVPLVPHGEILSFEELERLAEIFCASGVSKVRVTGGEPFARKGCLPFLQRLKGINGLRHLHITTNGVETEQYINALAELGIDSINLSLDTLDPRRFWKITRRDYFQNVMKTLHAVIEHKIPLKINSVILADTSDEEIMLLAHLAQKFSITVRFIEKMPFAGISRPEKLLNGNLLQRLKRIFPAMDECCQNVPSTARIYSLPGYKGSLGIIQGYSRLFCATCNKVRVTPAGMLKTCLYDNGVLDLKKMLRTGAHNSEIEAAVLKCIQNRSINGHEAELLAKRAKEPSMASIGG